MSIANEIEKIGEILAIIENARAVYSNDITDRTENEYIYEGLLDAGYHKQIKGEWIIKKGGYYQRLVCSNCGRLSIATFDYCPHCGAKMKGGAE